MRSLLQLIAAIVAATSCSAYANMYIIIIIIIINDCTV